MSNSKLPAEPVSSVYIEDAFNISKGTPKEFREWVEKSQNQSQDVVIHKSTSPDAPKGPCVCNLAGYPCMLNTPSKKSESPERRTPTRETSVSTKPGIFDTTDYFCECSMCCAMRFGRQQMLAEVEKILDEVYDEDVGMSAWILTELKKRLFG